MLFLLIQTWEELHGLAERGSLVEVEHASAHRTKKEKKNMSQFGRFVTEGNEKADELAKQQEQCWTKDFSTYAALQYAASFHCLAEVWKDCEEIKPKSKEKWIFVDQKREEGET